MNVAIFSLTLHPPLPQHTSLQAAHGWMLSSSLAWMLRPLPSPFSPPSLTTLQAAHGWMHSSPLASTLGAFINLEAMGAGGLPIVFQHTGAWTVEAYARCVMGGGCRGMGIGCSHRLPAHGGLDCRGNEALD